MKYIRKSNRRGKTSKQRDKKMNWLYRYKEKLDYIVFLKSSGLEKLPLKKVKNYRMHPY